MGMQDAQVNQTTVVLLHGLGRGTASMLPLELRLRHAGFSTLRIGYPSTRLRLADSLQHVRKALIRRLEDNRSIDMVGHSLGGLIAASLLRAGGSPRVRRVVQLGSPNLGAPLANDLDGTMFARTFLGPTVTDLRLHERCPKPDNRIGAIAGTLRLPGLSGLGVQGLGSSDAGDGTVQLRSALSGAGHTAIVPAQHTFLPVSTRAARLVIAFLRDGRFPEGLK